MQKIINKLKQSHCEPRHFGKAWQSKFFITLVVLFFSSTAFSAPIDTFKNEKLYYTIMWQGICIGEASMCFTQNSQGLCEINVSAGTNEFFSAIYPVEDKIVSIINSKTLLPIKFEKKLREGKHNSDESCEFNQAKLIATRIKNNQKTPVAMPKDTHDPISCLYAFRLLDMKKDASFSINSRGKNHVLNVNILNKETLEIRKHGTFKTIVVSPKLDYEGVFMHNGEIYIWFTDDAYKIPLKMECKLKFGKAVAYLDFEKTQAKGLAR